MKVFIVTSGSYDDYTIEGVFSTQKKADAFIGTEQFNNLKRKFPDACTLAVLGHWIFEGSCDLNIDEYEVDSERPFQWKRITEREWNEESEDNPGSTLIVPFRQGDERSE